MSSKMRQKGGRLGKTELKQKNRYRRTLSRDDDRLTER